VAVKGSAMRVVPAMAIGAIGAWFLLLPSMRVPPERGAQRLTEGFQKGRWDALYLVARRPAAVVLPKEPTRLTLVLSGPTSLLVRTDAGESQFALGPSPSVLEFVLPEGGRLDLQGANPIRLHEMEIARLSGPPWARLALAVVGALLGGGLALLRRGPWAVALGTLAGLLLVGAALEGCLGGVFLRAAADRFAPCAAIGGLVCSFFLVLCLPKASRKSVVLLPNLPLLFGALALASCLSQVLLLPQPLLIGDPGAYHEIGGRFLKALGGVRGPDDLVEAIEVLRPYGGLVPVGLFYGFLRFLSDEVSTIHAVQALIMAAAVSFLVRAAVRLDGARLGWITGVLALAYPTLPLVCGIVQPEPVILLLWSLSLDRLLSARGSADYRSLGWAGMSFAAGLAFHPQGLWFLLLALLVLLAPFSPRLREEALRRRTAAFFLGVVPVVVATAAGEAFARPAVHVLEERHGFWAYTAPVPLGFWLFLDTDGWQGPVRIVDTRYARGLLEAERADRVRGAAGRVGYTLRFIAQNFGLSVHTVLRNLARLHENPDNPFRRAWILPYGLQVFWHRALVVLFLLSVPLALARGAGALLLPCLILSGTYPLYHIFNKYALPGVPFLLVGAALTIDKLMRDRPKAIALGLLAAGLGGLVSPAELALRGVAPHVALVLVVLLQAAGLGLAFRMSSVQWATKKAERWAVGVAASALLASGFARSWGDPRWRTLSVSLDSPARHEVVPGPEGLARLDAAREAYLLLDLLVPTGDPGGLLLDFEGGLQVPGSQLEATMPPFGLATTRGGLDPRTFRQWWRTRWLKEMGKDGRVALTVRGPGSVRLFGNLATPGLDGVHDGLSLGEWPYLSVYRLMHEGEYRLPRREGLGTTAIMGEWAGRRLPGTLGVRLVTLDESTGGASWETQPVPSESLITGIWARAGRGARAELLVPKGSVGIELSQPSRSWTGAGGEVRFLPTGDYEGWYLVRTEGTPGRPLTIAVRPFQEMSSVQKYFLPGLRTDLPTVPLDWVGLPFVPPARILESTEVPSWRPAVLY